jgi:mRNA interferase RelE/StbE
VQIRPAALKALSRLSRPDRERIRAAIDRLPKGDVRPLQGAPGQWRLRVGGWRIRYRRDDTERIVDVTAVDHRGDAYKKR